MGKLLSPSRRRACIDHVRTVLLAACGNGGFIGDLKLRGFMPEHTKALQFKANKTVASERKIKALEVVQGRTASGPQDIWQVKSETL